MFWGTIIIYNVLIIIIIVSSMKVAIVNGLWFIQIRPIPLSLYVCARMCVHTVLHPYIMHAFSFRKLVGFKKKCRNYKKKDSLKASQVIKKSEAMRGCGQVTVFESYSERQFLCALFYPVGHIRRKLGLAVFLSWDISHRLYEI